jgi:starch synthase
VTPEPSDRLRILMVSAHLAPLEHDAGGRDRHATPGRDTGRAVGSLATALASMGHDVRVVIPRYAHIDLGRIEAKGDIQPFAVPMDRRAEAATVYRTSLPEGVTVYLVDDPRYFGAGLTYPVMNEGERAVFLSRAALELLKRPEVTWQPDIIHCHDWQAGLVPNWLRSVYRDDPTFARAASVFTIHDLEHQGVLGYRVLELAGLSEYGFFTHPGIPALSELVNLLARGVIHADAVTTVSETYATEILTPEYGELLDPLFRDVGERLVGILNGADAPGYEPASDDLIPAPFSVDTLERRAENKAALQSALALQPNAEALLMGLITHLDATHGWDLLSETLEPMLDNLNVQVAILGAGEPSYEDRVASLTRRYPGRIRRIAASGAELEHLLYAGSDVYLAPARVEPNGSHHLLAMLYGAVPVVHATGGLADAVHDYDRAREAGNGFRFESYDAWALYTAVVRAAQIHRHPTLWRPLQRGCMTHDISWGTAATKYVDVYRWAQRHRRPRDIGR